MILDHSVDNEEFVLKIYYDKDQFEHLIDQYVNDLLAELKNNKKLYDAGWDSIIPLLIGLKELVTILMMLFI